MIKLAKNPLRELTDDIVRTMVPIVGRRRSIELATIDRILKAVFPEASEPSKPTDVLLQFAESQTKTLLDDLAGVNRKPKKDVGGVADAKRQEKALSSGPFKYDCKNHEIVLPGGGKVWVSEDYWSLLEGLLGVGQTLSKRLNACKVENVTGYYLKLLVLRKKRPLGQKQLEAEIRNSWLSMTEKERVGCAQQHIRAFRGWLWDNGINPNAVLYHKKKEKRKAGEYKLGPGWSPGNKRLKNHSQVRLSRIKDGDVDGESKSSANI